MICFDTSVFIWGLQGIADSDATGMPARTARYIDQLDQSGDEIMIPAPVLIEYLSGIRGKSKREEEQKRILEAFFVPAVDVPVACLAADLNERWLKSVRRSHKENATVQGLPVEAMIAACAIVNDADAIVTADVAGYTKLVGHQIDIIEVPNVAMQKMMF